MLRFDNSQQVYFNLIRLVLEGRATHNLKLLNYAYDALEEIKNIELYKIENLTKYLVEVNNLIKAKNFEHTHKQIIEELNKRTKNRDGDEIDISIDWSNKAGNIKLGFWINSNFDSKYRETSSKFTYINSQIISFPKTLIQNASIVRCFYCKNDLREFQKNEFCPYISISGIFFIDQILYPQRISSIRNWEIKEVIGNKYKLLQENKENALLQTIKIRYKIELNKNVFIKNLDHILIGKYHEESSNWTFDNIDNVEFNKENKSVYFYLNELIPYSILLERKIFFPYKSWYLRCLNENTAVLEVDSNIL